MTARAAVILAAGQGTRMRSPRPKVLHPVGGRSMLDLAIDAAQAAGCARVVVVVGMHAPEVGRAVAARLGPEAVAVQDPPLGTAHAVLAAEAALAGFDGDVLVTNADCPLLRGEDLELVSRELEVTAAELSGWRDAFLAAGEASLRSRPADARDAEIGRLKEKVGDLTMGTELLEAKIERLEAARPLARRRSRR